MVTERVALMVSMLDIVAVADGVRVTDRDKDSVFVTDLVTECVFVVERVSVDVLSALSEIDGVIVEDGVGDGDSVILVVGVGVLLGVADTARVGDAVIVRDGELDDVTDNVGDSDDVASTVRDVE